MQDVLKQHNILYSCVGEHKRGDEPFATPTGIHHSRQLFKNVQFLIINRTLYAQKI